MTTLKHTPTPWVASGYNVYGPIDARSKHGNGRMLIGGVVDELNDWCSDQSRDIDAKSAFREETQANAALIVRAVNAHDALVEALETIRKALLCEPFPKVVCYAIRTAEDALRAAKGE